MSTPQVLLTRPDWQACELELELEPLGYRCIVDPMLTIHPVSWDRGLLVGAAALVVTSPNGARALAHASGDDPLCPVYAVGPRTAEEIRNAGYINVHHAQDTADCLLALIKESMPRLEGRVVYLSGDVCTVDIAEELRRAGQEAIRVVTYAAQPVERLRASTIDALSSGTLLAATFMSARTARVFCDLCEAAALETKCQSITAVALSAKVGESPKRLPWRQVLHADRPSRAALIEVVQEVRRKNS